MSLPTFLSLEDVLCIHFEQIESYGGSYGGSHGVRDQQMLESALMTPQASYEGIFVHSDLFEMAAAYAFHISENQAFIDGNKRTALASALVFLGLNGIEVFDPHEKLYVSIMELSKGISTKAELANLLQELSASEIR